MYSWREFENWVAISVVKYNFVNRDTTPLVVSIGYREEVGVCLDHTRQVESHVPSVQYSTEVALEEYHDGSCHVVGVHQPDLSYPCSVGIQFDNVLHVEFQSKDNVAQLGILC